MREINPKMKVESLKRKGAKAVEIAVKSARNTIKRDDLVQVSVGVGLYQGLKYNGDFKRGVKAGATTMGVFISVEAIGNIAHNWEIIKNA